MTRLDPAAPTARPLQTLLGIGMLLVLAILVSGCASSPPPAPTPDPFAGLADRSEQAYRAGLESYGQGLFREALNSFELAHTLSPTVDPRIEQMIDRSKTNLAPTPTPVPPTPTEVPVVPTLTALSLSTQPPDTDLGLRYFGQVTLAIVPGSNADVPAAASKFFFQDQIGLRIDGLKQHLRLPFELRVFNADTAVLVADVQSDTAPGSQSQGSQSQGSQSAQARQAAPVPQTPMPGSVPGTSSGATSASAGGATPAPTDVARFYDTFVWYHKGGEAPGRYRAELYANGVLTNTFDYTVVNVPIPATPVPTTAPTPEPAPTEVPQLDTPTPAPVAAAAAPARSALVAVAVPTTPPTEIPIPTPTVVPTPQNAYTTIVGGLPSGLDIDSTRGRFYIADTTGAIWSSDSPTGLQQPTLGAPFYIGDRLPVDLAVDRTTGFLYLSTRHCSAGDTGSPPLGCILVVDGSSGTMLKSIALPGAAGDLRIDSELGLLYVALPGRQELAEVDIRAGKFIQSIASMPQITSLAVDPDRHVVYAVHLGGQLTVIDGRSGQVSARISLTGPGLTSVATARGLAYAVNTATHELAVVQPVSQSVSVYRLDQEPAAVAASEDTGAVYVLSANASGKSNTNALIRIDPTTGTEVGRVLLPARSGHLASRPSDFQGLRPRLVLNRSDETVYATLPEAGTLAVAAPGWFPPLADIPQPIAEDAPLVASIPGVLRPGAPQLPSAPSPIQLARGPDPELSSQSPDEEGN